MRKRVAFHTLGCKLNFSETSAIARMFREEGFEQVDDRQAADVFVLNTCSVTEQADKKCRQVVKAALKRNPNAFVAVMGCYAQLKPHEIAEIPGVDAVLGAAEKFRLLELVRNFEKRPTTEVLASDIEEAYHYHAAFSSGDRTRTFLKVQDGCNYNCSFCTIPLARGKSRSDSIAGVVAQAERIAAETEAQEVVLTGVNIGDFGIREGRRRERFIDLLKALDRVEGIARFRISSIEPNLLSQEIIGFVAGSQRFMPHFHMPLQSGSDALLKNMYRRYDTACYTQRIESILQAMPHACIGTDVIVGFPGETEERFLETYRYLQQLPNHYLHVFTYSERANTPAAEMAGAVPFHRRKERSKMLQILSEKKRRAFYEKQQGQAFPVLLEASEKAGRMQGFSPNYVKVSLPYDPHLVNELIPLKVGAFCQDGSLAGEPLPIHA